MFLEIGHDQKSEVEKIINSCNQFKEIVFKKDYSGYYRIVQMRKSGV
jgi:release factor glutamine methyltransferase